MTLSTRARPGRGDCWPSAEQTLLLRAALLDGDAALAAFEAWGAQAALDRLDAGSARLLPLLYLNLRGLIDDPVLARAQKAYEATIAANRALLDVTADVIGALGHAGIETIVLKGIALVALDYETAGARPMSDADLLVQQSRALEARDVLMRDGWRPLERMNAAVVSVRRAAAFVPSSGECLDLHWRVFDRSDIGTDADFWQAAERVTLGKVAARTLCPADLLLHISVHGLRWSVIPPIRWAADALSVIRSTGPEMDWDRLVNQTERRALVLPMVDALQYLRDSLDAPVPASVQSRLEHAPVPRRARAEHRIRMRRRSHGRQFLFHWFQHRRLRRDGTFVGNLVRFPHYFQCWWGLPSLAALVPLVWAKSMRRPVDRTKVSR